MEETVFNIITYIVILLALFIAVRKLFQKIFVKNETDCSSGCGGCSTKCELKNLTNTQKVNL